MCIFCFVRSLLLSFYLAVSLASDFVQEKIEQTTLDFGRTCHRVSKEYETDIVDVRHVAGRHIDAVEIHKNVANHDLRRLVIVPRSTHSVEKVGIRHLADVLCVSSVGDVDSNAPISKPSTILKNNTAPSVSTHFLQQQQNSHLGYFRQMVANSRSHILVEIIAVLVKHHRVSISITIGSAIV